jgi:hypothetical protein
MEENMKVRYEAIDSDGELHWRKSERTYTHCVVWTYRDVPQFGSGNSLQYKGSNKRVSWSGSAALALKTAGNPDPNKVRVEIIEVTIKEKAVKAAAAPVSA